MILAIQENLVEADSVAAKLAAAQEAGFDALELRDAARPGLEGIRAHTVCPELSGWLGDFDAGRRARALDELRRQLDGIVALGGHGVITPAAWGMFTRRLPPFDEPPRTPEQDREVLLEGLAELGAHAEAAGGVLLLEPLNRYEDHMLNTVAQAAELIAAAGSPGVKILADTYHMNIEEDDVCDALRSIADVLGAVHASDSNRHQPGAGHVDFAAVAGTLRELGFDGVLSVECRLRGEPADAVRSCGALLRSLVD
ncbi:sugar phosphate isomerase/epimerase [Solirubrobacter sp. CPCC 204708]|uniref:Sugar phosphate isomerase/epimerase n=1 Tax=Solirubrobacter deserti TaxID=2282478 RepID=A0ABT4RSA1_9ACTN|nr:sugar phosphate isomerase/epimerase family protein [Solirubrobacter deserti]MBE2314346.1 sugar phosphate isomerase/epimerase [Solirubrobacter deserti]MDA0141444.1 sugar phosphate isomerase/epimerase [Solirubrobacter deserti]